MVLGFWGGLLIGFLLGVLASMFGAVWFAYNEFIHSIAYYRLQEIMEATTTLIKAKTTGYGISISSLRNRFRFSLGVILDVLITEFDDPNFNPNKKLPLLISPAGDRWDEFKDKVRPVINDINTYSFIIYLGKFAPPFLFMYKKADSKRFYKLVQLCRQIETVVGMLDAALDDDQDVIEVIKNEQGSGVGIRILDTSSELKTELIKEYQELHKLWWEWRGLVV